MPVTSGPTSAPSAHAEVDPFGSKAAKLAALFSLDRTAPVLTIGRRWDELRDDIAAQFERAVHVRSASELMMLLEGDERFELALVSIQRGGGSLNRAVLTALPALARLLETNGVIWLSAQNRFAARSLRSDPLRLLDSDLRSPHSYARLLAGAGLEDIQTFLPRPHLGQAEEFVTVEAMSSSGEYDPGGRFAWRALTHDGSVHLASRGTEGTLKLLRRLAKLLAPCAKSHLVMERFALRARGALVLVLRTPSSERVVARITTNDVADDRVRRNAHWSQSVAEAFGDEADLVRLIPRTLGSIALDRCRTAHVETYVPGVIGWRLARHRDLERVLFGDVTRFAAALHQRTARSWSAGEAFGRLFESPLPDWLHPDDARLIDGIRQRVLLDGAGSPLTLVVSHGDFGYGNVIADPATGHLRGVIDWDQARDSLAGIDLLNFLVLRTLILGERSLLRALDFVATRFVPTGFAGIDDRLGLDLEPANDRRRRELMAWCAMRIVQRNASYPALYEKSRDETRRVLTWASQLLQ